MDHAGHREEAGGEDVSQEEIDQFIDESLQEEVGSPGFIGYIRYSATLGTTITRSSSEVTLDENGPLCACGNRGCLEKSASATAIVAMAHMLHLGDNLTSKDVADLAEQQGEAGDKARAIFRTMGEALGIALATLVNTFNFPLYLLSGGPLPAFR